jgi:hypothetical protein
VLSHPITLQRFQTITGRDTQGIQRRRRIQEVQLPVRGLVDSRIKPLRRLATPDTLGVAVSERSDHRPSI